MPQNRIKGRIIRGTIDSLKVHSNVQSECPAEWTQPISGVKMSSYNLLIADTAWRYVHEKNGFAEISKNLIRYRSENNFVELSK